MTISEKAKNIAIVGMTASFLVSFAAWTLLKPAESRSVNERRPLATFPTVSEESVMSGEFMSSFEKYTLDQFPMRDIFRSIKALTSTYAFGRKDNNGIYISNGYISKLEYPINTQSISYAAERFRFIYESYLLNGSNNIYLSLIPDKNLFLADENGYPSIDYDLFASTLKNETDFAEYIDIMQNLELSDYYRTDTHWRQEKLTDIARLISAQMGVSLSAEYERKKLDTEFFGVYYGQSALPVKDDELYYLYNPLFDSCRVYDYETDTYIPIYDLDRATGNDPYEMFLSGSKSLLSIENPHATTNKELIVFRDSFGSSLAPLLAEGYKKITLVDIRYMLPNLLGNFIEFENSDILFLYSTSVLNNSVTIK